MPNKLFGQLYRLGSTKTVKEKEYRVRSGGIGYEKLRVQLLELGLELYCSYNKWYNVYDQDGNNVKYKPFDSLQDIKEWIKNDYEDWKKNGRQ